MQHLILIGMVISAVIAPFVLARTKVDVSQSLSAHIARSKWAIWFARIAILTVCALVVLWYSGWYIPTYNPSSGLTGLVAGVCVLAAIVAVVPRYEGRAMESIHDAAAYVYSLIIPFIVIIMAVNAHNNTTMYALVVIAYLLWAILASGVYKPSWKYFLYFQISFLALFGAGLLLITYMG